MPSSTWTFVLMRVRGSRRAGGLVPEPQDVLDRVLYFARGEFRAEIGDPRGAAAALLP